MGILPLISLTVYLTVLIEVAVRWCCSVSPPFAVSPAEARVHLNVRRNYKGPSGFT